MTSGIEDINRTSGTPDRDWRSPEHIKSGGETGALTLNSNLGTSIYAFAMNGSAKAGSLIELQFRGSGFGGDKGSGSNGFDLSVFSGGYALSLTGSRCGGRKDCRPRLYFPERRRHNFRKQSGCERCRGSMPTFAHVRGTYGVDATGHGTPVFVIPGFDGGTFNFALYAISANEYFLYRSIL